MLANLDAANDKTLACLLARVATQGATVLALAAITLSAALFWIRSECDWEEVEEVDDVTSLKGSWGQCLNWQEYN